MEDIFYAKDMYDPLGNEAREGAWYQPVEMQEQGEILFYMGPVVQAGDAGTLGGGAGHSDGSVVGRLVTRTRLSASRKRMQGVVSKGEQQTPKLQEGSTDGSPGCTQPKDVRNRFFLMGMEGEICWGPHP
ncbi:hypothetical protein CJ030_MR2G001320 [Morella rubra]|uniref:Uncharacterized protein n=1 Tax=Morella rubra TaxID=262757 RepID=A0A6A1WFN7_9ROSI|nr:hypothetical protein CJ030_MR2G001320 [Morella rubra]